MQQYIDLHSHSNFSPDADNSVYAMCSRAEALGLAAYAITDHCDMNGFMDDNGRPWITVEQMLERVRSSLAEMRRVRTEKEWKLLLLKGIELGQPFENPQLANSFLDEIWDSTDFIIGSLHNITGCTDFAFLDYTQENIPELLERYFVELVELVRWGRFDALGHITYPLRYMIAQGREGDIAPYWGYIDDVLRTQAQNGKAIEINTSGLRQKMKQTMPPFSIVQRFRELGGEHVTIGSDSHCTADVGKGSAEAVVMLKEAGFSQLTYFVRHKPVQIPIR
ncbi:MAG: histidinol-phosphatase HisJ family protein [Oscillospiraceae bacterium]|jgi:histidinol-phosphatase (PHP family)